MGSALENKWCGMMFERLATTSLLWECCVWAALMMVVMITIKYTFIIPEISNDLKRVSDTNTNDKMMKIIVCRCFVIFGLFCTKTQKHSKYPPPFEIICCPKRAQSGGSHLRALISGLPFFSISPTAPWCWSKPRTRRPEFIFRELSKAWDSEI